ncbi:DUF2141 domain-containing protein [Sandaracinobacteroides saxicola]|uniref:DUF2141 domain-containing protein n=1 Tax=Sandaracinobacteroides saxicola TaxID=2759707 RepID=A0A7G5IHP2_9SPHN|nr:DUF2141 domain-containing protein [Sandaracinobacteroides saxicola]QMW22884.1 DUF2141 domain-containing protein [Sandaracinobacteroides saxicola]
MKMIMTAALLMAAPALADSLTVELTGAKGEGTAVVSLWKTDSGFSSFDSARAAATLRAPIRAGVASVTFEGLAPGTYAVSAFHDGDGNGKMKTNFIGMPKEGVAVSGTAGGMPRFSKSAIPVSGKARISMAFRYL